MKPMGTSCTQFIVKYIWTKNFFPNTRAHAKKELCLKFKLNFAISEQYMRRMPKIKLTYFNIEGKAELIRLLLHAGNFEFEDFRVENLI